MKPHHELMFDLALNDKVFLRDMWDSVAEKPKSSTWRMSRTDKALYEGLWGAAYSGWYLGKFGPAAHSAWYESCKRASV